MKEFIEMVSGQLGVGKGTARAATGGLLGFLRDQVAAKDFGDLLGALPGSADLMGEMPTEQASGNGSKRGGLWETVGGKALAAIGADGLGPSLELVGRFKKLGLTGSQVGSFVSLFGEYAKKHLGSGLFARIIAQVPEIKRLVG